MPSIRLPPRAVPALLALAVLLAACEGPQPQDAEQRLYGTWLREFDEHGIRSRRVLVLRPDGVFHESVRIVDASGAVTEQAHEGTWFYDGTNLKRKYTLMNGRAPSRLNLPFATFEIRFETRNEFTGVDHIHGNRIVYRRVAEETKP